MKRFQALRDSPLVWTALWLALLPVGAQRSTFAQTEGAGLTRLATVSGGGGGAVMVTLDEERVGSAKQAQAQAEWLLDLDRTLVLLRERDERLARTVECRFFAGLSEEETAQALGVSLRTAQRNWMRARAWIRAELTGDDNAKVS